jgi:hypothetical protein
MNHFRTPYLTVLHNKMEVLGETDFREKQSPSFFSFSHALATLEGVTLHDQLGISSLLPSDN